MKHVRAVLAFPVIVLVLIIEVGGDWLSERLERFGNWIMGDDE